MADDTQQPSRDDYDAAARQVAATAEPGLSRDDFYARVDQALARNRPPPSTASTVAAPQPGRPTVGVFGSLVSPELKHLRQVVSDSLSTPAGTPIMARSRTGALYPSQEGTGAIDAAKNFASGAASAGIDQLENATSPAGLASLAVGPAGRVAATTARRVAAPALEGTGLALQLAAALAHRPLGWWSAYELLAARNPLRAVISAGAPYATSLAGQGLERLGTAIRPVESAEEKLRRLLIGVPK
jgi:hypothetical protein